MAIGRKTGGRAKGTPNKRTERNETAKQAAAAIVASIPGAFTGDAHDYLMTVYKDPSQDTHARIDCAKAAISYEKPRLATIAHTGPDGGAVKLEDVSLNETARRVAFMLARAAQPQPKQQD